MMLAMDLLQLSTDDASDSSETEQQPFDTTALLLGGIDAANRCDIHDNRNRKNMVPFLKSNYKYKRRIAMPQVCVVAEHDTAQIITPMTAPPQWSVSEQVEVEVERFGHLLPLPPTPPSPSPTLLPPSDSYFKVVAVGLIVSAAVIVFRDILLSLCKRVVRESRVWCKNSNKLFCRLSEMLVEVKRFTWGWEWGSKSESGSHLGSATNSVGRSDSNSRRWRYGMTAAAPAVSWSKSFGLEYICASLKLIYLTLFIALWMTAYEVEAGTCWTERMDNGKCQSAYSKNMTKAQCCGKNQMYSYTEKNLSNVEYFFALALGGGTECVPCLESCKDVNCGPNKRCVKRKGRPKCVCSPQCGSGKKHKHSHKRKQQLHQQNGSLKPPHVIDISRSKEHVSLVNFHSPITIRDIRSLSSEINNSNPSSSFTSTAAVTAMELTSPGDHISQLNSRRKNQRIPIISTSPITSTPTKKHQHRLHHHHHKHHRDREEQQRQEHHTSPKVSKSHSHSQSQRRHANVADRTKGDQLIITADDLVERPSTERDNDLPESNSLRIRTSSSMVDGGLGLASDTHHQDGRHHFKKHAKPKRKISDQNGATHNSFHNGTATVTTTTTTATDSRYRNEMKIADRLRHRPPSYDGFAGAAFSSSSAAGLDKRFKHRKTMPALTLHPSNNNKNNKNIDLHLGHQDNADDLTFDDKIHNGFFSNGFPYPHQELSTDEGRYTHPVCGSDGRTYNTECQLKKRACRTDNSALVVAYRGHCQTSCKKVNCMNGLQCVEDHYAIPHCIVCAIECPADDNTNKIDPTRAVCGVDGNTYKSTCDINRMVCKIGHSIAVAYPGPCREERSSCNEISCGPKMTCLADLLTHRPRCVSCKFKCSRKRRPANIRYEEGKLCGNNNRTYNSWCEMKKDSCQTGLFIDIKSIGECKP
ncbi:uncharacterized protein LOC129952469 [Eupeodes corollae]|uniref:uncharacterized protein LOC129952469 n=1 Tax=Eupeodes corollae TaxID=290404 RepID=UPI002491340E|nr:uncharacterized protein LOC129952469 [Eupeodes corollae]